MFANKSNFLKILIKLILLKYILFFQNIKIEQITSSLFLERV